MNHALHCIEPPRHHHNTFALQFLQQSHSLCAIKWLCQLTKAVQQHRGASMAFLNGDPSFLSLILQRQQSIETLLSILRQHNRQVFAALAPATLANIINDWKTIASGWQDDRILHNYEFHCHLVDILLKSIRHCMKEQLLRPLKYNGPDYQPLLEALFIQIPEIIESLAMLRGLSTHATVIKTCAQESHQRISFLLKKIPNQNALLMHTLAAHEQNQPPIAGFATLRAQQKNLYRYLISIQMNILDSHNITTDSTEFFNLSTEIIDTHWHAVEQGTHCVEQWILQRLTNRTG